MRTVLHMQEKEDEIPGTWLHKCEFCDHEIESQKSDLSHMECPQCGGET